MSASAPPPPQYFPPSDIHPQPPQPGGYPKQPQAATYPQQPQAYPQQAQFYNQGIPPQQYGYSNQSGTSVYVISPPGNVRLGKYSVHTSCPFCQQQIATVVDNNDGCGVSLAVALLCCIGCWPIAWIPCCLDDLKDNYHYCPNCQSLIGVNKAAGF